MRKRKQACRRRGVTGPSARDEGHDRPTRDWRTHGWKDDRPARAEIWPSPFSRRMFDWFDWPLTAVDPERTLRVEEFEDKGNLVVRAEMPGMDPDKDVHVQLSDHVLEIRAERKQQETHDEKGARRSEFRYGSFYRLVEMPQTAKESDISAVYKDGILEVSIPLETQPKPEPKAIPVARK